MKPLTLGIVVLMAACAAEETTPYRIPHTVTANIGTCVQAAPNEGEIYGDVWKDGVWACDTTHSVILTPDALTWSRLYNDPDSGYKKTLPLGRGGLHSFDFWDPQTDGGSPCFGFTASHASADTAFHAGESSKEGHCVKAGRYTFIGPGRDDSRVFPVDYILATAGVKVSNTVDGISEDLEDTTNSISSNQIRDLVIHTDLSTSPSYTDVPHLKIHNAGNDPSAAFSSGSSNSGHPDDWFQFSVATSTSSWNLHNEGRALARLYYNGSDTSAATGYYNYILGTDSPIIRLHRFPDPFPNDTVTTFVVGMELLRPDEYAANMPVDTHYVTIHTSKSYAVYSLTAHISKSTFPVGDTATGTATARNNTSDTLKTAWHPITWTSLNPSVATVNWSSGIVTGIAAGVDTIRATAGGVTGDVVITISPIPVFASWGVGCSHVTVGGLPYVRLTPNWSLSGSLPTGWTWEVRTTTVNSSPNPGTSEASGTSETSTTLDYQETHVDDWRYYWIRYVNGSNHTSWLGMQDWGGGNMAINVRSADAC